MNACKPAYTAISRKWESANYDVV